MRCGTGQGCAAHSSVRARWGLEREGREEQCRTDQKWNKFYPHSVNFSKTFLEYSWSRFILKIYFTCIYPPCGGHSTKSILSKYRFSGPTRIDCSMKVESLMPCTHIWTGIMISAWRFGLPLWDHIHRIGFHFEIISIELVLNTFQDLTISK